MNKAVFLDRDGVIIGLKKDDDAYGFILNESDVFLLPNTFEALKKFKEKGYLLIVITNQPSVARGIISEEKINEINNFINGQLNNIIDAFYFCPHHPEMHPDVPEHAKKYRIKCECRKPLPGMILQAAKKFDIDLSKSWMLGDMISDVATGKNAGCKTILIKSAANERIIKSAHPFDTNIKPDYYAENLLDAVKFIE